MRVLSSLVFALFPLHLSAQCNGPSYDSFLSEPERQEIQQSTDQTPFPQGLIWSAKQGETTLVLVGTMHLYDDRHLDLLSEITPHLQQANRVLLEMSPVEEAQAQTALLTQPDLIFLPNDSPTLPELLDEPTWQSVKDAAQARGFPSFIAAKSQPWYLSLTLAIPTCAMTNLLAGQRGLDHMIMDQATALDLPMQALEPWDTLFTLMRQDSLEDQLDALQLSMMPESQQSALLVSMLEGYFARQPAHVWELSRVASRHTPGLTAQEAQQQFMEIQTDLLDTRNAAWIPVIEQAAATDRNLLVAVGAAHLPGDTGLLSLLSDRGWTITRLDAD